MSLGTVSSALISVGRVGSGGDVPLIVLGIRLPERQPPPDPYRDQAGRARKLGFTGPVSAGLLQGTRLVSIRTKRSCTQTWLCRIEISRLAGNPLGRNTDQAGRARRLGCAEPVSAGLWQGTRLVSIPDQAGRARRLGFAEPVSAGLWQGTRLVSIRTKRVVHADFGCAGPVSAGLWQGTRLVSIRTKRVVHADLAVPNRYQQDFCREPAWSRYGPSGSCTQTWLCRIGISKTSARNPLGLDTGLAAIRGSGRYEVLKLIPVLRRQTLLDQTLSSSHEIHQDCEHRCSDRQPGETLRSNE